MAFVAHEYMRLRVNVNITGKQLAPAYAEAGNRIDATAFAGFLDHDIRALRQYFSQIRPYRPAANTVTVVAKLM